MLRIVSRGVLAALLFGATAYAAAQDSTAHCSLPGELVATDATGDATFTALPDPIPDHDVVDVYIAELPNDAGEQKVYFTLKVEPTASAALPATSYQIKFYLKDGVERFVLYNPYPTPAELNPAASLIISNSDLMFAYGHNEVDPVTGNGTFSIDGPADAESSAAADGTITIVLSQKQLRQLEPGAVLTDIMGVSQFNGAVVTSDLDASDSLGSYTLKGNDTCTATSKSAATQFGGAMGLGLMAPLALLVLGRRRKFV